MSLESNTQYSETNPSPLTPHPLPIHCAYKVHQLSFSYRVDHRRRGVEEKDWALRELTCEIRAGEVFGVIGPNGSGKSSLLKLLARLLRPQEGRVDLLGQTLAGMRQDAVARMVALVPQESPQLFPFTIAEVVLMGRFPHHRSRWNLGGLGWETREDIRLAAAAMADMDISHLAHRPITDVSGGERQRAVIARALTQQPAVLLLDEPTAFLDLNHQLEICRILRRLNDQRGLTVVLVSHDLNLASQYCDRLMLLRNGRLHRIGAPEEVIRQDVLEAIYGCTVLVDHHPISGLPRVTLPGREGR